MKHTKFIHIPQTNEPNDKPKDEDKSTKPKERASNSYVNSDRLHVVLPIVPVKIRIPNTTQEIETYALLDSGSTNTFCSQELVRQLGLKGHQTTLSLTTLEKQDSVAVTEVVSLEISDVDGQESIQLPHVYVKEHLPVPMENIPRQQEMNWPHLNDIRLPEITHGGVTLLIGQDVPDALVPLEIRRGQKGQPYATRTLLGWTLNGPTNLARCQKAIVQFEHADQQLEKQVERFWTMDDHAVLDEPNQMSINDREVVAY